MAIGHILDVICRVLSLLCAIAAFYFDVRSDNRRSSVALLWAIWLWALTLK